MVLRVGQVGRRVFYGWWIVLSCGCLAILGAGSFYYGLATFFLPITNEFGWPRVLTSSAFSLHRLEGGVSAPIAGFAFDRLGPRKLVTFGVVVSGAGFVLLSQVSSFPLFAIAVVTASVGFSFGFVSVGMATVANWFVRKRTTALGLLMAGGGVGGALVPVVAWLISSFGWRTAALVIGLTIWALGLPLSRVVRHRPEAYGLLPDGDSLPPAPEARPAAGKTVPEKAPAPAAEVNYGVVEALRSRGFWALTGAVTLAWVAQNAVMVHLIPFLSSPGLPTWLAAPSVTAVTVISIAGRLGFGWLGDRIQKRYVMALLYAMQVGGLVALANVSEPWHLIPFLALYAPSYGGAVPLRPAILGEYFGRRSFGTIQGLMLSFTSVGSMLGPVFAGWMFDMTGSYRLCFWILAAVTVLAIPTIMALPAPHLWRRRTAPAVVISPVS